MSHTASGGYPHDYYVSVDPKKAQSKAKQLVSNSKNSNQQTEEYKIEQKYGSLDLKSMDEEAIMNSIEQMSREIHKYEQNINRKISKHYSQLRPMPHQTQKTVENLVNVLKQEIEQHNKLIEFQQNQMKQIHKTQKEYDSRQNIELEIPIQISQTKKAIIQLQRFIHIAHIKQKKKSQDLVKVDKTNLQQFEKTAMLRNNLQVALLYQINLNERQHKCDEHMYQFQCKIDKLDEKLQSLGKIVEEKQIAVSSNKNLLVLKEKKIQVTKKRDNQMKKLMLTKHSFQKQQENINRDKNKINSQLKQKDKRSDVIEKQIFQLTQDSSAFLKDKSLQTKLRKSISFNYAQTLLTVKDKRQLGGTKNSSLLYSSMGKSVNQPLNQSVLLSKPNFKVKRYPKNRSMNSSMDIPKKSELQTPRKADLQTPKKNILLPVTMTKNPEKNDDFLLGQSKTLKLDSKKESEKKKSNKYGEEFDLISDD